VQTTLNAYGSPREVFHAESLRSAASRNLPISVTWDIVGEETSIAPDSEFSSDGDA
jgi:hypothetical protein